MLSTTQTMSLKHAESEIKLMGIIQTFIRALACA